MMIKRYNGYAVEVSGDSPWVDYVDEDDGEYVSYEDHAAELATLRAENEWMREKLGMVASDDWNNADWVREFAKEALK